jgi:protein-disulfide isomerase
MNHPSHPGLIEPIGNVDHVLGPDHAPIVMVEYGDFECPNCKQAAPAVKMLLERFDGNVRFAFRHCPLEDVHPRAQQAAEAAECAGAQGKFWEMHELLFEHQTHLDPKHLLGYAEEIGLDAARFTAELDDQVYPQRVRDHVASGKRSGVRGTPGFFINGRIQDVSFGLHALFDATEAALSAVHPRSMHRPR